MKAVLAIIINTFLSYEFVFVFTLIAVFFLIIGMYVKNTVLRIGCLVFFSIFLALAVTEYVLSFRDNFNSPWVFKMRHINDINKIYKIHKISEYDNKFRYTKCNVSSENSYVFLGCSFIFGAKLNDEDTVTYYFSKLMNFEANVINCGIPGHSINTSKNILNNDLIYDLCQNKKINHFFYLMIYDHLSRNFRILDPSDNMLYENGKYSRVKQPLGIFKIIFAKSYIFNKIFLPVIEQHNMLFYEEYMIESFESINKIIEDKYSSKLTIIIWPEFDQAFIDKLNNKNFDVIVLPEYFNSETSGCKIPNDGHPTAKANKEIAQILYNHINKTNAAN